MGEVVAAVAVVGVAVVGGSNSHSNHLDRHKRKGDLNHHNHAEKLTNRKKWYVGVCG